MTQSLELIRLLAPRSILTILDVGVQTRTDFLMEAFPDLHHHLFEPVGDYHSQLEQNYRSKDISHTLHKLALSDIDGKVFLHNTSSDGSGRVTHSYIQEEMVEQLPFLVDIQEIETRRLDSVFHGQSLKELTYLVKLDVDGVEEKIVEGGKNTIRDASFVIIEASIGRQDLCSRAALLEALGFRIFDICDNAYYFGQLALVDLIMINNRLRSSEVKFRPWQYTEGRVEWSRWQHGFSSLAKSSVSDPFK